MDEVTLAELAKNANFDPLDFEARLRLTKPDHKPKGDREGHRDPSSCQVVGCRVKYAAASRLGSKRVHVRVCGYCRTAVVKRRFALQCGTVSA